MCTLKETFEKCGFVIVPDLAKDELENLREECNRLTKEQETEYEQAVEYGCVIGTEWSFDKDLTIRRELRC